MTAQAQAPRPRRAVLALGSNLGDRRQNLQGAVDAPVRRPRPRLPRGLARLRDRARSAAPSQPDYLNAVMAVETALPARAILDRAHGVEDALRRVREVRWGPRTLDVDLIVVGDEISDDPGAHPAAPARA